MQGIIEHIKRGNVLVWSSTRMLATTTVLWLYAAILAAILYGTHALMLSMPSIYPLIIALTFAATFCKIFIMAFIIHQVMNLPGGIRPTSSASMHACMARLWPLAVFAVLESLVWGVCMVSGICIYRAAYIVIATIWYTITLPVIPLIVDNHRSLYELFQATIVIDAKIWLEALIGSLYSTLALPLLYYVINYALQPQTASPMSAGILYLLSALIVVLEAIFKAMVYRAADRSRLEELSELEAPYF